jgi:hypothetical protein
MMEPIVTPEMKTEPLFVLIVKAAASWWHQSRDDSRRYWSNPPPLKNGDKQLVRSGEFRGATADHKSLVAMVQNMWVDFDLARQQLARERWEQEQKNPKPTTASLAGKAV